ncbi:MAG: hypothetical protein LBG11_02430, partial [Bifidobacteriaceae bacterium]|nr:hypothetical protein [Bifidobacteriaceae bacterium]
MSELNGAGEDRAGDGGIVPGEGGPVEGGDATSVRDTPVAYPVTGSETVFQGRVWNIVADQVTLPDGSSIRREYMYHPGAVAIIAG